MRETCDCECDVGGEGNETDEGSVDSASVERGLLSKEKAKAVSLQQRLSPKSAAAT